MAISKPSPVRSATAFGGRVELWADRVRIRRRGVVATGLRLLLFGTGTVESDILLSHLEAVEIVSPLLLPSYVIFRTGGTETSGDHLADAFLPESQIMGLWDRRDLLALIEAVRQVIGQPPPASRGSNRWP